MFGTDPAVSTPRIFLAELSQETNSFCPLATGVFEFQGNRERIPAGDDLVDLYRGTNTVLGGMLEGCRTSGWQVVPSIAANAHPCGPLTRDCYETLRDRILEDLRQASPDGVLLALHGAMVADGYPDPEGDLLSRVRTTVGVHVPIVGVLDLHGNVSATMVAAADILIGYREYPHVDTGARGEEAATLLSEILAGRLRPSMALVQIPALLVSMNMRTDRGPMADTFGITLDIERRPGAVDVSLFGGFPYSDVPDACASTLCTTNGDFETARRWASEAALGLWTRRDAFSVRVSKAEEGVRRAMAAARGPVAIADVADNPASGGVGDHPTLLRTALRLGAVDTVASLFYDPETVRQAFGAGEGAEATFCIGGKVPLAAMAGGSAQICPPTVGAETDLGPVEVRARVHRLSDGRFTLQGPMGRGLRVDIGKTAVLTVMGGPDVASPPGAVEIVVAERRRSTDDPEMLRVLGIEPTQRRLLLLKSKGHFRAAFGPIVAEIIDVDTGGVATLDLRRLPFRHVRRPIFPLDDDVAWQA